MINAACPSCGAPLKFVSQASLYVVCAHCATLVLRKDLDVEKVGEVAALQEDGTPLQIGTSGRYGERPFEVIGRIQLQYPQGYWNEWFITFGNREGWIGEAQGMYGVTFPMETADPLPKLEDLRPGLPVVIKGEAFQVTDVQNARCIGGEGELPFEVESGYEAPVADLSTPGARFATLDYSGEKPLVFVGEYVEFDALQFRNLREVEGW